MTDSDSALTWQNSLVRIAFLLTLVGAIVIVIFMVCVVLGTGTGDPGAIATPVVLLCLMGVMVLVTGMAIERESLKRRLPKVTPLNVSILVVASLVFFSVKSFIFGLGIGTALVLGVFLFKEFESRVRAIAVCVVLVCWVVAEANRRAGGYDSGGVARYIVNIYAFSALFFPGLLVMSTMRRLPYVSTIACGGCAILTLHSAASLCASMTTVLDNSFDGKGQNSQHEYCIDPNVNSPMGFIVDAFREAMFPPYQVTNTTTTTAAPRIGATTTTTLDCMLLLATAEFDNNTNFTNDTEVFDPLHGVDMSHCIEVAVPPAIPDPNSTTTSTTSTTSTSTTSTSTTSTSSTSTTSTSTTSTTTSTTSTTTSTTSTSTSTSTSTLNDNETDATTSTYINTTIPIKVFALSPFGRHCHRGHDVTTDEECREAARQLGLVFGNSWNGPGNHRFCHFADDGRSKVFFNLAGTVAPKPTVNFASVCWKVPPDPEEEKCKPGTPDTKVGVEGMWAIAVFSLAGFWCIALWFVFIIFSKSLKVHPDPLTVSDDPYGLQTFRDQKATSGMTYLKKLCKKICKVILKSTETIIGTAVFIISGIAIAVTGSVQLPKAKPECAKEPRLVVSLIGWAEEPGQRYAVVWCEYGSLASVLFSAYSFCCFLLAFTMSLRKVMYFYHEDRKRRFKQKLRAQREHALERGEAMEDHTVNHGDGFRLGKMIPQEPAPPVMLEDYDGKVYDC